MSTEFSSESQEAEGPGTVQESDKLQIQRVFQSYILQSDLRDLDKGFVAQLMASRPTSPSPATAFFIAQDSDIETLLKSESQNLSKAINQIFLTWGKAALDSVQLEIDAPAYPIARLIVTGAFCIHPMDWSEDFYRAYAKVYREVQGMWRPGKEHVRPWSNIEFLFDLMRVMLRSYQLTHSLEPMDSEPLLEKLDDFLNLFPDRTFPLAFITRFPDEVLYAWMEREDNYRPYQYLPEPRLRRLMRKVDHFEKLKRVDSYSSLEIEDGPSGFLLRSSNEQLRGWVRSIKDLKRLCEHFKCYDEDYYDSEADSFRECLFQFLDRFLDSYSDEEWRSLLRGVKSFKEVFKLCSLLESLGKKRREENRERRAREEFEFLSPEGERSKRKVATNEELDQFLTGLDDKAGSSDFQRDEPKKADPSVRVSSLFVETCSDEQFRQFLLGEGSQNFFEILQFKCCRLATLRICFDITDDELRAIEESFRARDILDGYDRVSHPLLVRRAANQAWYIWGRRGDGQVADCERIRPETELGQWLSSTLRVKEDLEEAGIYREANGRVSSYLAGANKILLDIFTNRLIRVSDEKWREWIQYAPDEESERNERLEGEGNGISASKLERLCRAFLAAGPSDRWAHFFKGFSDDQVREWLLAKRIYSYLLIAHLPYDQIRTSVRSAHDCQVIQPLFSVELYGVEVYRRFLNSFSDDQLRILLSEVGNGDSFGCENSSIFWEIFNDLPGDRLRGLIRNTEDFQGLERAFLGSNDQFESLVSEMIQTSEDFEKFGGMMPKDQFFSILTKIPNEHLSALIQQVSDEWMFKLLDLLINHPEEEEQAELRAASPATIEDADGSSSQDSDGSSSQDSDNFSDASREETLVDGCEVPWTLDDNIRLMHDWSYKTWHIWGIRFDGGILRKKRIPAKTELGQWLLLTIRTGKDFEEERIFREAHRQMMSYLAGSEKILIDGLVARLVSISDDRLITWLQSSAENESFEGDHDFEVGEPAVNMVDTKKLVILGSLFLIGGPSDRFVTLLKHFSDDQVREWLSDKALNWLLGIHLPYDYIQKLMRRVDDLNKVRSAYSWLCEGDRHWQGFLNSVPDDQFLLWVSDTNDFLTLKEIIPSERFLIFMEKLGPEQLRIRKINDLRIIAKCYAGDSDSLKRITDQCSDELLISWIHTGYDLRELKAILSSDSRFAVILDKFLTGLLDRFDAVKDQAIAQGLTGLPDDDIVEWVKNPKPHDLHRTVMTSLMWLKLHGPNRFRFILDRLSDEDLRVTTGVRQHHIRELKELLSENPDRLVRVVRGMTDEQIVQWIPWDCFQDFYKLLSCDQLCARVKSLSMLSRLKKELSVDCFADILGHIPNEFLCQWTKSFLDFQQLQNILLGSDRFAPIFLQLVDSLLEWTQGLHEFTQLKTMVSNDLLNIIVQRATAAKHHLWFSRAADAAPFCAVLTDEQIRGWCISFSEMLVFKQKLSAERLTRILEQIPDESFQRWISSSKQLMELKDILVAIPEKMQKILSLFSYGQLSALCESVQDLENFKGILSQDQMTKLLQEPHSQHVLNRGICSFEALRMLKSWVPPKQFSETVARVINIGWLRSYFDGGLEDLRALLDELNAPKQPLVSFLMERRPDQLSQQTSSFENFLWMCRVLPADSNGFIHLRAVIDAAITNGKIYRLVRDISDARWLEYICSPESFNRFIKNPTDILFRQWIRTIGDLQWVERVTDSTLFSELLKGTDSATLRAWICKGQDLKVLYDYMINVEENGRRFSEILGRISDESLSSWVTSLSMFQIVHPYLDDSRLLNCAGEFCSFSDLKNLLSEDRLTRLLQQASLSQLLRWIHTREDFIEFKQRITPGRMNTLIGQFEPGSFDVNSMDRDIRAACFKFLVEVSVSGIAMQEMLSQFAPAELGLLGMSRATLRRLGFFSELPRDLSEGHPAFELQLRAVTDMARESGASVRAFNAL